MKKFLLSIGSVLLFGFGAMAQNTVVADCESDNQTALGTYWYSYASANEGLPEPTITPVPHTVFTMTAEGANHFAKAEGTLRNTAQPGYGSAGIGFAFKEPEGNFDLTGATGISFKIRSSRQVNFSVMNSATRQESGEDFSYMVPAKATWTTVIVRFPGSSITADGVLAQPDWAGLLVDWDPTKVTKLQWQVKDTDGPFEFSIDDVTVLGKVITNKLALQQAIYDAEGAIQYAIDENISKNPGITEAFQLIINAAKAIMASASATQAQVDEQITILALAKEIFEADTNDIPTVASSSIKVYATEGGLTIEGGEGAVIYGIDGSIIASTSSTFIPLSRGIYIVKVGSQVVKAIVK